MSRPAAQSSKSSFATKTTWEALEIESGEETDEEVLDEPVVAASDEPQAPPTKSAIKRAKALARAEKKAQEKAMRAAARRLGNGKASATSDTPTDSASLDSSPATHTRALEISDDVGSAPAPAPVGGATKPSIITPGPQPMSNGSAAAAHRAERPPPTKAAPAKTQPATSHVPTPRPPVPVVATAPTAPSAPPPAPKPAPPQMIQRESKPLPSAPANAGNEKYAEMLPTQAQTQEAAEKAKKRQGFLTRTLWTFIMIGGFITLLLMGHAYMVVLVFVCQTLVYREVTSLFSLKRKGTDEEANGRDPWSKTLNWYFFAVSNYFLYGESIIYYFKYVVFSDAQLTGFAMSHRFISFSLYILGFMGFVMSLKRGYLKQQFGLFCWVHMTLLLIVVSSHFIVNNILEGMIWFWVPASLVICNDCFAYIWGVTIGRTPLFKLSPKKTVEGFVGALFSTIIFGILWGSLFMRYQYMICPVHDLGVSAWDGVTCTPNPAFVWRDWAMPKPMSVFLSTLLGHAVETIPYTQYHFHLFFLSCFASLVAPFGGFFASGFKRAFDIKDFGHSIPGHGGMTDRMDCQFLMGVFTYVYYSSLIRENNATVGSILQLIVSGLSTTDQLELMKDLKRYLEGQGIAVKL